MRSSNYGMMLYLSGSPQFIGTVTLEHLHMERGGWVGGYGGNCLMWEVSPFALLSCNPRPLIKHVIKGPLPNQS